MKRFLILAALALGMPVAALGQTVAPVYQGQDGQTKEALGTFCVSNCGGGGGGGGGGDPSSTGTPGSAPPATVGVVGGTDGSVVRRFLTDGQGRQFVNVYTLPALPAGTNLIGTVNTGTGPADVLGSGSIITSTASAAYTVLPGNGQGTAGFVVTGLTGTGATLTPEATNDGVNWIAISGVAAGNGLSVSAITTDGQFRLNASGRRGLRLRVTTTGTGTATVASTLSFASWDAAGLTRDSNGDARVPTVTVTPFFVNLSASTSTEILAASTTRIGYDIQCTGTAAVGLSRTHATLTSATPSAGGVDLVIPAGTTPYFQPAYVSGLGVTAYTGTAQTCWGNSYARQ